MVVFHQHESETCHHAPEFNSAFIIAIVANGLFVLCQLIFARMSHSTSLFADAIHNLGDVLSLLMAWIANRLLKYVPTSKTTYGMKKASILAAFSNVIILVFTCGVIVTEAIYKFIEPTPVEANWVMLVAAIGIVVNGATAALFAHGNHDLNIRAAFLHLLYDALVSLGVVIGAGLLAVTGWLWLDPLVGLIIAVVILKGIGSILVDSFRLIIDGVPSNVDIIQVKNILGAVPGVQGVHDLHIWALSTRQNALSVHLWMPDCELTDEIRQGLTNRLKQENNIHHATIQVERVKGYCEDACNTYL